MKKAKYSIDLKLAVMAIPLLCFVLITGCSDSQTVPESKKVTCTEKQSIKRGDYDQAIEKFNSRKKVTNFRALSKGELREYWLQSAVLVNLFEDDLRACVIESNGSISEKLWKQKNVDAEYKVWESLTQILLSDGGGSSVQRQEPGKSTLPTKRRQKPPTDKHSGLSSSSELERFVSRRFSESINAGKVSLELGQVSVYGSMGSYSQSDLKKKALDYYKKNFSDVRPVAIEVLVKVVTMYTTPSAKVKFAVEDSRFTPVLEYYKEKYNKDLSQVVVIEGPISSIPHAAGSFVEKALGLYISPVVLPVTIQVRLPLHKIDSSLDRRAYLSGNLIVKIEDQLESLIASLKFHYGSEMIFHIDSTKVAGHGVGQIGFEGAVAHELRHLLDFFECHENPTDECSQENLNRDWGEVKRVGQVKQQENYQIYINDPQTAQSKREIMQVYAKYRPSKPYSEREKWADDILRQVFNQAYLANYQNYFSLKEYSAYKEQMKYLVASGMSKQQAVALVIKTTAGGHLPLTMDGAKEYVSLPGFPWLEAHLESMIP